MDGNPTAAARDAGPRRKIDDRNESGALEAIEAGGITAMAPPEQAEKWRALLQTLAKAVESKDRPFGSATVHDSQITLLGGPLASRKDYEQLAALLAAARTHRPI